MTRHAASTEAAPQPAGPYSQSVRIGTLVAAAGQSGADPSTGRLVSDDDTEQTRQALRNVAAVLEAAGASMDDVVRVGVFLTDPAHFEAMNTVYAETFARPFPARTTVYVGLPSGMLVEIDALAVVG